MALTASMKPVALPELGLDVLGLLPHIGVKQRAARSGEIPWPEPRRTAVQGVVINMIIL
jgi:hypothetical protein